MNMTRREAVKNMAILMGATVVGPRLFANDFGTGGPTGYTAGELALLDEIGETIIPTTDTPGAKATGIGAFIAMMVTDCYPAPVQAAFKAGLARFPQDYEARFGEKFLVGKPENRTEFLNALEAEQRQFTAETRRQPGGGATPPHYFRLLRELTTLGYFTSEIGATETLHYLEVPGRYDGNVPYKKGDPLYT